MKKNLKNMLAASILCYYESSNAAELTWAENTKTIAYLVDSKMGKVASCFVGKNNDFSRCRNILDDPNYKEISDIKIYNKRLYLLNGNKGKILIYNINQEDRNLILIWEINGFNKPTSIEIKDNKIYITDLSLRNKIYSFNLDKNGIFNKNEPPINVHGVHFPNDVKYNNNIFYFLNNNLKNSITLCKKNIHGNYDFNLCENSDDVKKFNLLSNEENFDDNKIFIHKNQKEGFPIFLSSKNISYLNGFAYLSNKNKDNNIAICKLDDSGNMSDCNNKILCTDLSISGIYYDNLYFTDISYFNIKNIKTIDHYFRSL
ncbi:hypothetical protein [Silvanigrella sp.]|uniref:hypothetical protein n=1 Tax=Silvanigrella sp. TaxID=2024976 RepID=UPI0037C7AA53